ncbi:unnamed protein product [Psylliodes chrysocephalus]|uniref:Regulatory protein zeste n=1 Tax=Psylliodes chrysocephalus TaxID=3402493 RepID=A0A9P0GGJ6_9CUCU|nr:unnamed protein product [Psylliodes chrysocephala]
MENKRKRSSYFTNNNKLILINIVAKYKHIIENKKTDAVTSSEKMEFNRLGTSCPREVECLKRCYDNRKKLLRKSVACDQRELYKTGGGLPEVEKKKEPGDDLLLSILSKKTVVGMDNLNDDDAVLSDAKLQEPETIEVVYGF